MKDVCALISEIWESFDKGQKGCISTVTVVAVLICVTLSGPMFIYQMIKLLLTYSTGGANSSGAL